MPKFTENGVSICLKNNYFQFEKCSEYKVLSGRGVKEIDFGWLDTKYNTLWLIELKGYINPNPKNIKFKETNISNSFIVDKKINELLLKSIHSVCMINNKRSNTIDCVMTEIKANSKIKLLKFLLSFYIDYQ